MSVSSISMSTSPSWSIGTTCERGERGLALALRVERAHAHEPVHAALGLQPAVRVPALDDELGRREAGLGARRGRRRPRPRSRAARPSAGTCAAASRPSPARRRRPHPTGCSHSASRSSCSPVNSDRSSSPRSSRSQRRERRGDLGLLARRRPPRGPARASVSASSTCGDQPVVELEVVDDRRQLAGDLPRPGRGRPTGRAATPRSRAAGRRARSSSTLR